MALNDNALITFELAQSILDLDNNDKEKVEFYINSISQRIEQLTNRKILADDYTQIFDGDGTDKIILKHYPVNSITEINLDSDREFAEDTKLDESEYYYNSENGQIKFFDSYIAPKASSAVKVIYNAGYSTVPTDLQQAVIETVNWTLRRFASNSQGFAQMSGDGMQVTPELSIPTSAYQVIMTYKRHSCK